MPRGHGWPGSGMFDALGEPPYEACAFFVSTLRSASQQVGKAGVPGLLFTSSSALVPSLFPLLFLSTSAAISLFLNPCLPALDSSILLCSLHLGLTDQRQVWILRVVDREILSLCEKNLCYFCLGYKFLISNIFKLQIMKINFT